MENEYVTEYQYDIVTKVKELMYKNTWKCVSRKKVPANKDEN